MPSGYQWSPIPSISAILDCRKTLALGGVAAAVLLFWGLPSALASSPLTNQFQVNTTTGSYQEWPAVASDAAGNFVVVWESWASSGSDNDSRSVQGRLLSSNGVAAGPDFQINSSTAYNQKAPAVAMNSSGAFVAVWESNHNGSNFDIMAQRYSAAGARVGSEILVNSVHTAGDQLAPAVAMADNGDFVIVWRSAGGAGGDPDISIQGRRWRASDGTFFDQFLVNDVTTGDQDQPAVATNGRGRYLVAWQYPGTSSFIAVRTFTADNLQDEGLTAAGPQQRANTHPSGPDSNLSVAMASDGRAIVGWETFGATFGNDNQRISIQARRLDSSGAFIDGNDVQINTYIPSDQRYPSVAIAANGTSAVAWQSYGSPGNDSSEYSIQMRAFDADGVALDPVELQANTYINGDQTFPAAVLAPTGKLLVTWGSNGSSGDDNNGFSIQGRLFRVFNPPSEAVAIPAAARVAGSGAFFTSRVDLYHSGSGNRNVAVTYTPRADLNGATRTASVSLPGNTQLSVNDPLATWFGFAGGDTAVGSLLLDLNETNGQPSSDVLLAQSVVFARKTDGSEFGQFFPAMRDEDALVAGQIGYLASTVNAQVYRVNVGLMGLADGTRVKVTPQVKIGTPLAPGQTFDLDRGDNRQLNNIFNVFQLTPRDNIVIAVEVISGSLLAYGSILDGNLVYTGTSDPTTILPVTGGAPQVTLLELGPIRGLNEFSGSASVTNHSAGQASVRADFFARGTPGVRATATFTIPGGTTVGYEDIIGGLFGLQGVGTLRLTAENGTLISASGREFAIYRDAQGTVIGTAGQAIPGMLPSERLESGATYLLLGLREVDNPGGRERSHIAAFNPGAAAVTLSVEVFNGATGVSEGTTQLTVRGGELIQTNSIISVVNPAQNGQAKWLEVRATGPLYVRAFRVNKDGDPITIPPQRKE